MATKSDFALAGRMLGIAADQFSNHGCNDVDDETVKAFSREVWVRIGKRIGEIAGFDIRDEQDAINLSQRDDLLMNYLADVMFEEATKK